MKEWKEVKLGDIASFKYGTMPKKELLNSGKYPTYSGYKYQYTYPIFNCSEGDLILVARGVGGTGDVKLIKEKCHLTNLSIKIDLDDKSMSNKFMYYYFLINNLKYLDSGSAQSQITITDLSKEIFIFPPLPEQKAIAQVLSSLDDKIELLNQQNKTLEQMAETLFRQWFVEEAEEHWEEVELGDLVEIRGGFSYKGEFIGSGDSILLGMGCVSFDERFLMKGGRQYSGDCSERYFVAPGDIVIATRQQSDNLPILGFPAIVPPEYKEKQVIVGTNLYMVKNISSFSNYFLYLVLRSKGYREHIMANAKGSTVRMITKDAIETFTFQIPSQEKVMDFEKITRNVNELQISILSQIQTLISLRDTLLPKLMSGEVRVKMN